MESMAAAALAFKTLMLAMRKDASLKAALFPEFFTSKLGAEDIVIATARKPRPLLIAGTIKDEPADSGLLNHMKQLSLVLILVLASAAAWALPSRADSGLRLAAESAEPCAEPCDRAAVVFIHGYTGARETWTSGQAYWPALLAGDSDLKDRLDIYSVVYDSFLFSGPPIREVVADLGKELDALMVQKRYAKVIFICHSLGGIIARQYLLHVKNRWGHIALGRFRLVITLGTPMQGSSLVRLAELASSNEQLRVLGPIRTNDYLQLLIDTVRDFTAKHEGCPSLKVFAAYEELGVTGVGIVVDKESATLDASEVKGFNRDHISLPKPAGTSDEVYVWAKRSMVDCLDGLGACPAADEPIVCPPHDFPAP